MADATRSIEIRYFAAAADAAGCAKETIEVASGTTLETVRDAVLARHGASMEPILRVSAYLVGEEMTRELGSPVGDRVDILPPFAGG